MRLTCLGLLLLLLFSQCRPDGVKINVELSTDADAPLIVGRMIGDNYQIDTLYADIDNKIRIELGESELEAVNIRYEKTSLTPVVSNGDIMLIKLTKGEQGVDVIYEGDNAPANNYKVERERELSYGLARQIYSDNNAARPFAEIDAEISAMHTVWLEKLNGLINADKEFVSYEEHYLQYYFNYIKSVYPWYMTRQTGKTIDADSDFNAYIAGIVEDTVYESVEMYYQVFEQKVNWYVALERNSRALGDSARMVEMGLINELLQSQPLKNRMLSRCIRSYLSYGINSMLDETFELYQQLCTDDIQKQRMKELYDNASKLMPGKPAPDFDMYTKDGKKVMLSDLKGKYVYFDVWATWCGPCKAEIPHLARVAEALKGKNNVEIISISVDADHKAWVTMIEEDQPQWKQFIVKDAFNSTLARSYNISGIPQFTLIDPDGKIIDVQAMRPSHPELLPLLKSY